VALLELARLEDAWIKLSAPERVCSHPYDAALPYLRALVDVRPDRILWGTDFPHPNLSTPVDEADLIDLIPNMHGMKPCGTSYSLRIRANYMG
jgi:predicted TIM-barrel fold metal-dependent hydrolase